MKTVSYLLAFSGLVGFSLANADTIRAVTFPAPDPDFIAIVDNSLGTLKLATPIFPELVNVFDDSNVLLSTLSVADGGQPELDILFLNSTFTEEVVLSFDQTGASIDGSGNLLIPATGATQTEHSDPGINDLLTESSTFVFAPTVSSAFTGAPSVYDFSEAFISSGASVPEPAMGFTVGIGLFAIAAFRARKRI